METQRLFGERLLALLAEKNISQQEFAEKTGCSRQSINYYILGKRSPDIIIAGNMASLLGVSCDYLIGISDYRDRQDAKVTVEQVGIAPEATKIFGGLKIMADGLDNSRKEQYEKLEFDYEKEFLPYNRQQARRTLDLLNALLGHDTFGQLLQFIKRYRDLLHGEDEMTILQNFMIEMESPFTGKKYGTKEENEAMMREFCRYIINQYFDNIVRDICK